MKKKQVRNLDENARNRKTLNRVFWILPLVFLLLGFALILLMIFKVIPRNFGTLVSFGASGVVDAAMILILISELIWTLTNDGPWRKFGLIVCFLVFLGFTCYASYLWCGLFKTISEATSGAAADSAKQESFLLIIGSQALRYIAFAGGVLICRTGSRAE